MQRVRTGVRSPSPFLISLATLDAAILRFSNSVLPLQTIWKEIFKVNFNSKVRNYFFLLNGAC